MEENIRTSTYMHVRGRYAHSPTCFVSDPRGYEYTFPRRAYCCKDIYSENTLVGTRNDIYIDFSEDEIHPRQGNDIGDVILACIVLPLGASLP